VVDIVQVGLSVDSRQVDKGTKSLDKLAKQGTKTETATNKMSKSFRMMGSALAAIGFLAAMRAAIGISAAFEKLEASLITVTGSVKKATQAMDGITQFATSTPFQIQEITDAFIKLKSLGIEPTEANLKSFGNTASAMGKSLNQFIEAVADAATNEFERLKEFGIKARQQGDKVSFTFQGVTTTIQKNSEAITGYLQSIGEVQFAGAMERQMDTLDGAFSNFSDTIDVAVKKLSEESGFNDLIKSATLGVASFIRSLTGTETVDDFNIKIDKTNELIDVWNKRLQEAKKAQEGAFFGGFFTSGAIQAANQQLKALNTQLAELQASVAEQESKKGGITKAGARTPEEEAALQMAARQAKIEADALAVTAENDQFQIMMDLKRAHNEEKLAADRDYWSRLYNMETGSLKAAMDFGKAMRDGDLKGQIENGALMLSNMSKTSRTAFEIQKAYSLAKAIAALPSAVMDSYNNGGGYPWGLIPAGLMLATGLQQINSIRSTSFGGGGAPAAVSGCGGTSPSSPVASGLPPGSTAVPDAAEQPTVRELRITVEGDGPNSEGMRKFAENLAETIEDMGGVGRLVLS